MSLNITDALRKELRPQGRQNKVMYLFKCATDNCSNELWVESSRLSRRQGKCRSCTGRNLIQKNYPGNRGLRKRPYEWLWHRLKQQAASRGLAFTITYEQFLTFTTVSVCHYCGSPVTWTAHNLGKGHARTNLDRKNNEEGYVEDNLVVACIICNRMKNNYLSYEEMMELSPTLRRILPQKNWVEIHKKKRFGHHLQEV